MFCANTGNIPIVMSGIVWEIFKRHFLGTGDIFWPKKSYFDEKIPFSTILVQKNTLNRISRAKFIVSQILYIGLVAKTSFGDNNTAKHADFWTKWRKNIFSFKILVSNFHVLSHFRENRLFLFSKTIAVKRYWHFCV